MSGQRTASAIYSLWWHFVLGVFLALCAPSLVKAAHLRYQMGALTQQMDKELRGLRRSEGVSPQADAPLPQPQPQPLRLGRRCIQRNPMECVEDGWEQLNIPS